MFERLQQKWKVNGWQLFCILCVFAVTGTLTAYLSKIIPAWLGMTSLTLWVWKLMLRLAIFFFGYQFILLTVAFFFGQFRFFWIYEKKILRWLVAIFTGRK
jgi:hypothetical protein